jgi:hypothetical protein
VTSRASAIEQVRAVAPVPVDEAKVEMGRHVRGEGTVRTAPPASQYVKTKAGKWITQVEYESHEHGLVVEYTIERMDGRLRLTDPRCQVCGEPCEEKVR